MNVAAAGSRIGVGFAQNRHNQIDVNIANNNDYEIENARVRAYIPELGIITSAAAVNLDDDEKTTATMYLLDEVPEGEYLVRISVTKGGIRKVVYRHVVFE